MLSSWNKIIIIVSSSSSSIYVKIQFWDALTPIIIKKVVSCTVKCMWKHYAFYYALMLVDINLIILFAWRVMCS